MCKVMLEYSNILINLGCTIFGALISAITTYLAIKLKSSMDEKIKTKEIIFNEKKKIYFEYCNKLNLTFDYDINDIEKNLICLSYIELIADKELYQLCQNLPQFLIGISTSKNEEEKSKNRSEYAKHLRLIKDAMRKELKNTLEIK